MSRFEKKCFIGSASLHGMLLICFVFGSAFLGSKETVVLPPVVTLMAAPTDKAISSGGNPNGGGVPAPTPKVETPPAPTPNPPPPEPVKPEPVKPEPVKPQAKQREPEPEPEPVRPKVSKVPDRERAPKDKPVDKTPKDTKNTSKDVAKTPLNLKTVRITNNLAQVQAEAAAKRAADARQKAEYAAYVAERSRILGEVGKIAGNVGSTLGKGTVAEPLGPGAVAFANYGSLIIEHYKRAVYASNPQSDHDAEAVIKVVVSRDGTVRSSQWVRRTSNPILNKAVDRAMNTVRSLPSFPPESKDSERSFNITIEFEAGRVSA